MNLIIHVGPTGICSCAWHIGRKDSHIHVVSFITYNVHVQVLYFNLQRVSYRTLYMEVESWKEEVFIMSLHRLVAITVLMFYLNDCWLLSSKCYQMINKHTLVFKYRIIWEFLLGVMKCIVQSSEGTSLNKGNRLGCGKDSCKYETNIDVIILSDQYQKSFRACQQPGFPTY